MSQIHQSDDLGPTRWGVAILAVLAGVIAATQIGKVPPAMSVLGTEFAVGMVALGWIASIFNATGAVLGLPFGALSDGFGHRRVLVLSLWTIVAGSTLGAFADNYALLFVTRIIEGVGYLGIIVAAPSLIVEATNPRDFGLALGLWSSFLPLWLRPDDGDLADAPGNDRVARFMAVQRRFAGGVCRGLHGRDPRLIDSPQCT